MAARNGSRREALLSPDMGEKPTVLLSSGCSTTGRRAAAPPKRAPRASGYCVCRRAVGLLRFIGGSVVQALSYISRRRSSSAKVSPKTGSRQFPPPGNPTTPRPLRTASGS
ncbi:unnamed protein product [Spirodela intermedia]|uniref:Uncharacterized protein n=1 Tax=Spirodela intermedia TaxID=51605 RepID=A0A7I8JHQ6_SPIIN|nr:unnamed protein product [Spirodela intermedia]CAA6669451.1 unnamed protein product [Spirodela intermedia]